MRTGSRQKVMIRKMKKVGRKVAMTYNEFKMAIKEAVNAHFGKSARVYLDTVTKTNDVESDAIIISKADEKISSRIDLRDCYLAYEKTGWFDKCVETIVGISEGHSFASAEYLPKNWNMAKPRLQMRMINREWNQKRLREIPFVEFLDFAIIFYVFLKEGEGVIATCMVGRELMEQWKVKVDDLWCAAWDNLRKENFQIVSLDSLLESAEMEIKDFMTGSLPDTGVDMKKGKSPLYVVMNELRSDAGRVILRSDILRHFAREQNSSFFILPSSIHEVLLVKDNGECVAEDLKKIVFEVNRCPECIDPEECLSDSVYYYSKKKGKVEIVT